MLGLPRLVGFQVFRRLMLDDSFFRGELIATLRIIERGDIAPERLTGSWAGAFGQTQFMPDNYLRLGVDQNGDGHVDIWGSDVDALASAANLLAQAGERGEKVRTSLRRRWATIEACEPTSAGRLKGTAVAARAMAQKLAARKKTPARVAHA